MAELRTIGINRVPETIVCSQNLAVELRIVTEIYNEY